MFVNIPQREHVSLSIYSLNKSYYINVLNTVCNTNLKVTTYDFNNSFIKHLIYNLTVGPLF